jgi:hypothetical protein
MDSFVHNYPLQALYAALVLWLVLLGPFLALWIALSIRRDLRRIADALEPLPASTGPRVDSRRLVGESLPANTPRRVANSAFGR